MASDRLYSPDLVDALDVAGLKVLAHEHPANPAQFIGIHAEIHVTGRDLDTLTEYLTEDEACELRDWLNDHFPKEKTDDHH